MKSIIGVVGPCAAGKTTLVSGLRRAGYEARHIAQEHSYVADMWKRLIEPDILIYLNVSYPLTLTRRNMDWTKAEYDEQLRRLSHAHKYADLFVDTDTLSPQEVFDQVQCYINEFD